MKRKLGLIVNPTAGLGGRVGLKGSDGRETLYRALDMGARPEAPSRTVATLEQIQRSGVDIELITYPHEMGENEAYKSHLKATIIGSVHPGKTTAEDTRRAAREMRALGVDLILFSGGDGTARDVASVIGTDVPVMGIPAGVKMHSAVFATSPASAGRLVVDYFSGLKHRIDLVEAEVMDIDEVEFRQGRVSARLYGYLRIPYVRNMVQCPKAGSCAGEIESLRAIATHVVSTMEPGRAYIIGTGTTTRSVMEKIGLPNTLLGVDVVLDGRLLGLDVNESKLLNFVRNRPSGIIVGVIGAQGYILGRGNQQISSQVIERVGKNQILVIATPEKLLTLRGRALLVDTGSTDTDRMLTGYLPVITGLNEKIMMKVDH